MTTDDLGSARWLSERRNLLRGGHAYSSLPGQGGRPAGGSPRWLTALAGVCVLWTLCVAAAKYGKPMLGGGRGPVAQTAPTPTTTTAGAVVAGAVTLPPPPTVSSDPPTSAAPAESAASVAPAASTRSLAERTACLDLVVGEMLLIDPSVSSPRQAALVWLAELVVAQGVRGDFVESGNRHGGTATLLFAALMCSGEPTRRLWTEGDWREDINGWAATWQARPGLAWRAEQLMKLPADTSAAAGGPPAALKESRIALLVCGGSEYEATAACLRRGYPLMRRGGLVLVEEYYKHEPARRATDELLAQPQQAGSAGGAQPSLYAVGEQSRPRFGFNRKVGPPEPLRFADVGTHQVLAANVSEAHPLLRRVDKCCNADKFDAARCCRPHAALWQA